MSSFENDLTAVLTQYANMEIAQGQSAYMRDQFQYFGIKTPERREITKPFFHRDNRPGRVEINEIISRLWMRDERDFQYIAQSLAEKVLRKAELSDIELFEFMVITKPWWDTVDFIASKLIGNYFATFPETIPSKMEAWLASNNIWLQRSALLFQLRYKQQTDKELLAGLIDHLSHSKEFFIRKAIGWALREYSKTNPNWVVQFVESRDLSGLSHREALKLIHARKK